MAKREGTMIDKLLFGSAEAVDISSTNHQFAQNKSSLYIGGTGNVRLNMGNGEEVVFVGIQAGTVIPVFFNQIHQSGSTATSMLALN